MTASLRICDLTVRFRNPGGAITAVEDFSLDVGPGETVAVVGESGSGKSTAALSVLRLLPSPPGEIAAGRIEFEGRDLLALSDAEIRRIRGRSIAMIFQDPMMALNPVYTIGRQIGEVLTVHLGMPSARARARAVDLLRRVGVPAPERRVDQYPHMLSGGMRQRAMIAMALACEPALLIADEPTTALDVTIQAQVLELIRELKTELGMAVLLITHDLGVVAETAQRMAVMYAGRKVEEGPVDQVFGDPRHPYTRGLLDACRSPPRPDGFLPEIPGVVPSPFALPAGCRFAPRCPCAVERCRSDQPDLLERSPGRLAACFRAEEAG